MSKQFWGIIAVVILAFAGIIIVSGNKSDTKSSGKNGETAGVTQHIEGNTKSSVKLVEYGDYECPYCEAYSPNVTQAVDEFKDQIQFQFRNFPLVNAHRNAFAAARAAEAAGLQGKFWEMHDALYQQSNWQTWGTATDPTIYFKAYAAQLGLKSDQFKTDFASSKVNDLINADMTEGNRLQVSGTPTFFLNGKQVQIGNSLPSFEKVLKAEIAKHPKITPATTTTPAQ